MKTILFHWLMSLTLKPRSFNNKILNKKLCKCKVYTLDEEAKMISSNIWSVLKEINEGKYKSGCLFNKATKFSEKRYLSGLYTYNQIENIFNEYGFELFCTP